MLSSIPVPHLNTEGLQFPCCFYIFDTLAQRLRSNFDDTRLCLDGYCNVFVADRHAIRFTKLQLVSCHAQCYYSVANFLLTIDNRADL